MSFWQEVRCPQCGMPGAKKFLWMVKCGYFDCPLNRGKKAAPAPSSPAPKTPRKQPPLKGNFNPGENAILIDYQNFRGEQGTFTGDSSTLRRKGEHLSLRIVPTGKRCTFSRSRIRNLAEVEAKLPPGENLRMLTAKERQVLAYHKKHGTTSELYEKVRAKLQNN